MQAQHASIRSIVALSILLAAVPVFAQSPVGTDTVERPMSLKVGNRALQRTAFQVTTDTVVSECNTAFCQSTPSPVFVRTMQCDGAVGKTCTIYLHIDVEVAVLPPDQSFLRFLVDGALPTPGPIDASGLVPLGTNTVFEPRSFGIVAYVTNRTANQKHDIEIDVLCRDDNGNICVVNTTLATLQASVYTP